MTLTAHVVCLILAFISFLLGAFGVSAKVNWTDLGFALVVLAFVLGGPRIG